MSIQLSRHRPGILASVLTSLVVLVLWPVPAASQPRLLWQTEPQGG